ncbi:translation initiation factor IF-2-like [Cygnus atratus]|uniref:translation initiation factor IF-2-like n=1 Tax=Cygnus atratus TaxID=8868 RepID=UPI0021B785ED|nr:translation initiation factor IF-2-like [Cygnus atratus]
MTLSAPPPASRCTISTPPPPLPRGQEIPERRSQSGPARPGTGHRALGSRRQPSALKISPISDTGSQRGSKQPGPGPDPGAEGRRPPGSRAAPRHGEEAGGTARRPVARRGGRWHGEAELLLAVRTSGRRSWAPRKRNPHGAVWSIPGHGVDGPCLPQPAARPSVGFHGKLPSKTRREGATAGVTQPQLEASAGLPCAPGWCHHPPPQRPSQVPHAVLGEKTTLLAPRGGEGRMGWGRALCPRLQARSSPFVSLPSRRPGRHGAGTTATRRRLQRSMEERSHQRGPAAGTALGATLLKRRWAAGSGERLTPALKRCGSQAGRLQLEQQ